jgi:GH24 family phage-related lysozyme (muramidase)
MVKILSILLGLSMLSFGAASRPKNPPTAVKAKTAIPISQESLDLIVYYEVGGSRAVYVLQSVAGLKGRDAYYNGLPKVKHGVHISFDQAKQIFTRYTLPKFTKSTKNAFVLTEERLHPHSNGALVSLVYNRGPSMSSKSSRLEMRQIRSDIASKDEHRVPDRIRSMKRLWSYSKLKGLHLRRDAEAKLFQKGLDRR